MRIDADKPEQSSNLGFDTITLRAKSNKKLEGGICMIVYTGTGTGTA
jgi:hypothetical protein